MKRLLGMALVALLGCQSYSSDDWIAQRMAEQKAENARQDRLLKDINASDDERFRQYQACLQKIRSVRVGDTKAEFDRKTLNALVLESESSSPGSLLNMYRVAAVGYDSTFTAVFRDGRLAWYSSNGFDMDEK